MSNETRALLQGMLNSINNPAFIKLNNKTILQNNSFKSQGFSVKKLENQLQSKGCCVEEKKIDDQYTLYEIVNCDVHKLRKIRDKIAQALSLL